MSPESYHFGTRLAKRFDYYAFPRTGSHYLWACLTGLLDLVFFPNSHVENAEARQRADELNPYAFYVLRLRDADVPYQPVHIDAAAQGTHGVPAAGDWPVIMMIRDPHPTIYSWYHTAVDRWGANPPDRVAWLRDAYAHYRNFYRAALEVQKSGRQPTFFLRFEELKAGPEPLERLVSFLDVRPKLAPKFVHWWSDFDRITRAGPRTFYRAGNNAKWREDAAWCADLAQIKPGDFSEFGYPGER
jgi:hypothetical protein